MQNTHPELKALCEGIIQWRQEIQEKTRPDPNEWSEVLEKAGKIGIKRDFLNFVLILCEWWNRIRSPSTQHIMKALKHRTSLDVYDPFRGKSIWPGEDTRGVPLLINRYVDHHIEKFWDEGNSALSRILLKSRMDQLAKEMDCSFRIATLEPIPPQKGGHGWQAPWVTAIVIYQVLRKLRPQKIDSMPIDMALLAFQASVGKLVDQSRFHKKRRELLKQFPGIDENLEAAYKTFLREGVPATALLEPQFTPLDFAIISFRAKKKQKEDPTTKNTLFGKAPAK